MTNKGGLLYNVISRSGTNQFHGGGDVQWIEQRDERGEHVDRSAGSADCSPG